MNSEEKRAADDSMLLRLLAKATELEADELLFKAPVYDITSHMEETSLTSLRHALYRTYITDSSMRILNRLQAVMDGEGDDRVSLEVATDEALETAHTKSLAAIRRMASRQIETSGKNSAPRGPEEARDEGVVSTHPVVTTRQLLESGVHFGHQTRRWNPKMKRFILTDRNGIFIIDLQQSLTHINRAYEFVKQTVAHGGSILFVGTKKQAQEPLAEQAARVGMPYVNQRWLGGMLTNFSTVSKRLQRLKELEQIDFDHMASSGRTKKELLMMRREKEKLERTLGGIRDMARTPSAIWVVDINQEHLAVDEARKLGIPVVAILDTNCDPDVVDYRIPGNDDAIRSITLLTRVIADAVADGLRVRSPLTGERSESHGDSGTKAGSTEDVERPELPLAVGDRQTAPRDRHPVLWNDVDVADSPGGDMRPGR